MYICYAIKPCQLCPQMIPGNFYHNLTTIVTSFHAIIFCMSYFKLIRFCPQCPKPDDYFIHKTNYVNILLKIMIYSHSFK